MIQQMIKWEQPVFALPFALNGVLLLLVAAHGTPPLPTVGWILVAMVSARSAAVASNRWADATLEAANPRIKMRAIPAGCSFAGVCAGLYADHDCGHRAVSLFRNQQKRGTDRRNCAGSSACRWQGLCINPNRIDAELRAAASREPGQCIVLMTRFLVCCPCRMRDSFGGETGM